ncbi:MAG: CocE/NonD family hydrolase [Candidatus Latescibacteria bacterium]|nr:CocE/NonD family hydrolase [Candidatus Latescibacterota bacterium]
MARRKTLKLSEPTYDITVEKNVIVPMRDGTRLVADVYRPKARGAFPVLIERTPYNKDVCPEIQLKSPEYYGSRGYVTIIQDTRGRFASGGEFYPFEDDGWGPNRDGYDTIEWAAAQPWSNGKVGTIGGSYSGATQYRLAPTRPPHLTAMFVRESSSDYNNEWVYRNGAFELGFMLSWATGVVLNNIEHLVPPDAVARERGILQKAREADLESWFKHLPLNPYPVLARLGVWYNDMLDHPDDGPYWWRWNIAHQHREIDIPVYHLGGWYDIFQRGTLENFKGVAAYGRSDRARQFQKLIVGPWVHGPLQTAVSKAGDVDFGPDAIVDLNPLRLRWFDYWLKGIDNGIMDEPPVRVFVMGANAWRDEDAWPPKNVRYTPYYLHSGRSGSIRSLNDGTLSPLTPPATDSPDSFVYDPMRPVPNRGGATLGIPGGPFDQRPADELSLTYTTPPLMEDLTVIGPVTCILYAMSSAPDTDWVVKLCDVAPNGFSMLLTDGILRARYRESRERQTLMTSNRVYRFEVDVWATAHVFKKGHRVRVVVTSSNFPRFDRNLNTGGPFGKEVVGTTAVNTVFHDSVRASYVVLPVVGEE